MTPTDYEIVRLMAIALVLFIVGCGPAWWAERNRKDNDE